MTPYSPPASVRQRRDFCPFVPPAVPPAARNSGRPFVAANRKRVETLRAALGEDSDFVIDCAAGLTPGDAASLSDALERLHPLWLDEPCEITSLAAIDRKSTRLNSSHLGISYAVFCLKKK